ncbi:MAG: glycosyltransferase [Prevotella sp.]
MIHSLIVACDFCIWLCITLSALYVIFFALASWVRRHTPASTDNGCAGTNKQVLDFLILIPAYAEDSVICQTVQNLLQMQYPRDNYHIAVISDHQQPSTDQWLLNHVDTLHTPQFQNSSKAKALQYAVQKNTYKAQYVVILDADNVVEPTFLSQLCGICTGLSENNVVQCHRQAKNHQTPVALLDAISEEINNAVFRSGHNAVGLPAALIGSGMCFPYSWFSEHVHLLETAGEDKELELLLLRQNYQILFAEHIAVYDEKVTNSRVFNKQRSRWITAQVQCLLSGIKDLPQSIARRNTGLIDKTLQQLLIPRSLLLLICFAGCVVASFCCLACSIKWWIVFVLLVFSLWLVIPSQYKTKKLFHAVLSFPVLCYGMILGILKIDRHNKDFTHTSHGTK